MFWIFRITGAVGKGLAALTFDDEYQKKRRQALNKKPANFQEGIARSSKGLVMVNIIIVLLKLKRFKLKLKYFFSQLYFRVLLTVSLVLLLNL